MLGQGPSLVAVMEELGITEIRLSNAVSALASSNGLLTTSLKTANTAWDEKHSTFKRSRETRYATLESKTTIWKNSLEKRI